jgi:nicotinamidase-related amidase
MTAIIYSADDTALLIVDPYNDFMSEGGKLYERTKETAEAVGFYVNECRNRRLYLFARSRVV